MHNVFNSVKFVVLKLSTLCNLKCKHCITFTPYQKNPHNFKTNEIKADIDRFFEIFDEITLNHFDFGGGEPFLHPDLTELTAYTLNKHSHQFTELRILTNGSLSFPKGLLDVCKNGHVFFILDDYGESLSPKVKENAAILDKLKIPYRINIYHGDNQYFNGWFDFGDLHYQDYTPEQLETLRLHCYDLYSNSPISNERPCDHLHIKDGKIYTCDIQLVGAVHVPVLPGEYIDLRSQDSVAELRHQCLTFKTGLIECCKYCNGFFRYDDKISDDTNIGHYGNKRIPAGIQLTKEELENPRVICR